MSDKWKKRTQRDYTLAFKLRVVEDIEKGVLTYKQAQKKYGIQGRSTVLVWLRKHGSLDWLLPNRIPCLAQKKKHRNNESKNWRLLWP